MVFERPVAVARSFQLTPSQLSARYRMSCRRSSGEVTDAVHPNVCVHHDDAHRSLQHERKRVKRGAASWFILATRAVRPLRVGEWYWNEKNAVGTDPSRLSAKPLEHDPIHPPRRPAPIACGIQFGHDRVMPGQEGWLVNHNGCWREGRARRSDHAGRAAAGSQSRQNDRCTSDADGEPCVGFRHLSLPLPDMFQKISQRLSNSGSALISPYPQRKATASGRSGATFHFEATKPRSLTLYL